MSHVAALPDANLLYSAPIRDILLQLGVEAPFREKWTADIYGAWIDVLLRNEPQRDRAALEQPRILLDMVVCDDLITSYETVISCLELIDAEDRH